MPGEPKRVQPSRDTDLTRRNSGSSLRVEGKADRTLTLYAQSIVYFSRRLTEPGLPADLSSLTRDNVRKLAGLAA